MIYDACFMTHQIVEQNIEISYPLLNKVSCMTMRGLTFVYLDLFHHTGYGNNQKIL